MFDFKGNIALNKKTSQSKTHSIQVSSLAVDGNDETCSIALGSAEIATLAWWQVDLNGTYDIDKITISYYPRRACMIVIFILVSIKHSAIRNNIYIGLSLVFILF